MKADVPDAQEVTRGDCNWCDRPLDGTAHHVVSYHEGEVYETDTLCESCKSYGPPISSRRERIELAWKLENKWSLLEKIGWWLVKKGGRK